MHGNSKSLRRWLALLYFPWIAMFVFPDCKAVEPLWDGMPFFYWYPLLWLLTGGVLTGAVLLAGERDASADAHRAFTAQADPMDVPMPLAEMHFDGFEGDGGA
jgi:hypothetical protein